MPTETLNYLLALGTIALQLSTVGIVAMYSLRTQVPHFASLLELLTSWARVKGFFVTLLGFALTLYYSDILGFIPCGLCWFERICLYPQAVLFAVALKTKDRAVYLYSMVFSAIGAVIALYHHYLQMGGTSAIPCPASGAGDCAQRILFEFGYITFPLMAFSLFSYLFVVTWVAHKLTK